MFRSWNKTCRKNECNNSKNLFVYFPTGWSMKLLDGIEPGLFRCRERKINIEIVPKKLIYRIIKSRKRWQTLPGEIQKFKRKQNKRQKMSRNFLKRFLLGLSYVFSVQIVRSHVASFVFVKYVARTSVVHYVQTTRHICQIPDYITYPNCCMEFNNATNYWASRYFSSVFLYDFQFH